MLSSDSIVKVRLFEAWLSQLFLGKYFTITGQMDLDESQYHAYPEGEKATKENMSIATCIPGGKGGTLGQ